MIWLQHRDEQESSCSATSEPVINLSLRFDVVINRVSCLRSPGLLVVNSYLRSVDISGPAYISLKTTEHKSMGAVFSLFVVATWTTGFGWILTISPIFRKLNRVAISRQLSNRITSGVDVVLVKNVTKTSSCDWRSSEAANL